MLPAPDPYAWFSQFAPWGNGCTAFLDGNWRECCDFHDWAYSVGFPKHLADEILGQCVAAQGHPIVGFLMFAAVSIFGGLFYFRAAIRRRQKSSG